MWIVGSLNSVSQLQFNMIFSYILTTQLAIAIIIERSNYIILINLIGFVTRPPYILSKVGPSSYVPSDKVCENNLYNIIDILLASYVIKV